LAKSKRAKALLFRKKHSKSGAMKVRSFTCGGKRIVAVAALGAILFALALSSSASLHALVHPDSNAPDHQCAVTLLASGSYEHSAIPIVFSAPKPSQQFATIPALKAIWVAAPFLGASIFEHAPPVLS
jgi:hypothetical protein